VKGGKPCARLPPDWGTGRGLVRKPGTGIGWVAGEAGGADVDRRGEGEPCRARGRRRGGYGGSPVSQKRRHYVETVHETLGSETDA